MDPATAPEPMPIDPTWIMADQSRTALMIGHDEEWLDFRRPFSLDDPDQVARLRAELEGYGTRITLPEDDGVHYLVFLPIPGTRRRLPMLIPEGQVTAFVAGYAAARGREAVEKVTYRVGLLPVDDPTT